MNCDKAQRLVQNPADGSLSDDVVRQLQRHLADCTDCRVVHQRATRLQQLLAIKRHEQPGPDYFNGFLREFHQRRAEATAPQPTLWERMLGALRIQNVPTLRHGFAHAFGVVIAAGMIMRGLISADASRDVSQLNALSFGTAQLQPASTLPAPHSMPLKIASLLPSSTDPTFSAGGVLILPIEPRSELSTPRYVLDRISRSASSYEVASIHF
jgi:anti-sigma factor RsiW